jgi:hypothetical protein
MNSKSRAKIRLLRSQISRNVAFDSSAYECSEIFCFRCGGFDRLARGDCFVAPCDCWVGMMSMFGFGNVVGCVSLQNSSIRSFFAAELPEW